MKRLFTLLIATTVLVIGGCCDFDVDLSGILGPPVDLDEEVSYQGMAITDISPDTLVAGTDTTVTVTVSWRIDTYAVPEGVLGLAFNTKDTCAAHETNVTKTVPLAKGETTLSARIRVRNWGPGLNCGFFAEVSLRTKDSSRTVVGWDQKRFTVK
jgi:hypothetical protein